MPKIKNAYLLTALAAGLGFAAVPAQAASFASSILNITDFKLLHSSGAVYSASEFPLLTGTNDAHATAHLNGVFANAEAHPSITATPPNLAHQCVGACFPIGEDVYTPVAGLPPVTTTYGYADQKLVGSIITAAGADASTRADASTAVNATASGRSDVGTSSTFNFVMGATDTMTVEFTGDPYTRALVTTGGPISNANARLSWSINIVDLGTGSTVLSYTPHALNAASLVSATHGMPTDLVYAPGASLFSATSTSALTSGTTYQLTIQHNTFADALQNVPEPASLAMMAAGLMGMAVVRRRRSS